MKKKISLNFLEFFEKSQKMSYLKNYKNFSSHKWRLDSQPPESILIALNYRVGNLNFEEKNYVKFSENFFKKITKKRISRKLKGFELSHMDKDTQSLRVL